MKKPFFEPSDFIINNDIVGLIYLGSKIHVDAACRIANAKLEKESPSWITVYGSNDYKTESSIWRLEKTPEANRIAKLAFIEEIAKEPCPHRVRLNSFSWVDSKTREVLAKTQMTSHCELCGVMLVAEWKTK